MSVAEPIEISSALLAERLVPFVVKECREILRKRYPRTFAAMQKEAESSEPRPTRQTFAWKLAELAYLVEKYKPDRVLELGSGLTTVILNEVLPGKVTTIEESREWADKTLGMTECDMHICPVHKLSGPQNLLVYELPSAIRDACWPLLYVDGPNTGNGPLKYVGKDASELAASRTAFDMRTETVQYTIDECQVSEVPYRLDIGFPGSGRLSSDPWFFYGFRYHTLLHLEL